jgi:hypothetical protein
MSLIRVPVVGERNHHVSDSIIRWERVRYRLVKQGKVM